MRYRQATALLVFPIVAAIRPVRLIALFLQRFAN
jgi:hypothetical protein